MKEYEQEKDKIINMLELKIRKLHNHNETSNGLNNLLKSQIEKLQTDLNDALKETEGLLATKIVNDPSRFSYI